MMNWLKKIFSRESEKSLTDRNARIRLLSEDSVKLIIEDRRLTVTNLSGSGVGFCIDDDSLSVGDILDVSLDFDRKIFSVQIEVVRKQENFVGAKFTSGGDHVTSVMRMVFMDEFRASEMSEVSSERLAVKLNGKPRWFYGAGNYELFFIEEAGNVIRFEMEWQGQVFAREFGKPLRAGIISEEDREKPSHIRSAIVRWQSNVSQESLVKAARIVENIPGLELNFRKQIQKYLLEI